MTKSIAVATLVLVLSFVPRLAAAPPMADEIADEVLIYVGWSGTAAADAAYAQSNLKAVLEHSTIPELFNRTLPELIQGMGGGEGEQAVKAILAAAQAMWRHPTSLVVSGVELTEDGPLPRITLLCRAGEDSAALRRQIEPLLRREAMPVPIAIGQNGDIVILSVGRPIRLRNNPEAAAPRATLADNRLFQQMLAQVQKDALLTVWADGEGIIRAIDQVAARYAGPDDLVWQRLRDAMGVKGIKGMILTAGFEGKDWGVHAFVSAPAPRAGVVEAMFDTRGVSDDTLRLIPRSATWAAAQRIDAGKLIDAILAAVGAVEPSARQEVEQMVAAVSQQMGVDLRKDVVEAIGDEWAIFLAPEQAGSLGFVVANRLKNAVGFEKAMTAFENIVNAELAREMRHGPRIQMRQVKMNGLSVHYLTIPGVAPCWAVKDGVWYASLYPQPLLAAVEGAGKGQSILNNDAFVAFRKGMATPNAGMIEFMDLKQSAQGSYMFLLAVNRVMSGMADMVGAEIPEPIIPPLTKIMPVLAPAGTVAWTDDSGWHLRGISPFPGSTALASPLHALGGQGMHHLIGMPMLLPAMASARQAAMATACMSNLRQLCMGVILYSNDHKDAMPATLAETWPYVKAERVYVCPAAAIQPRGQEQTVEQWINQNSSYVYIGSGKMSAIRRPSEVVIIHEKVDLAHDGMVNAAFADGHVERIPVQRAKALIERSKGLFTAGR